MPLNLNELIGGPELRDCGVDLSNGLVDSDAGDISLASARDACAHEGDEAEEHVPSEAFYDYLTFLSYCVLPSLPHASRQRGACL